MQQFYQDANSDPPVDIKFAASVELCMHILQSKIKPNITSPDGWGVAVTHKEVCQKLRLD